MHISFLFQFAILHSFQGLQRSGATVKKSITTCGSDGLCVVAVLHLAQSITDETYHPGSSVDTTHQPRLGAAWLTAASMLRAQFESRIINLKLKGLNFQHGEPSCVCHAVRLISSLGPRFFPNCSKSYFH